MIEFGDDQIEEQLKNVNERIMYTNYSAEHCTVCFKTVYYITFKSGLDVSHSFSNAAKQANIFSPFPFISSIGTSYICLVAILPVWEVGYLLFQELSYSTSPSTNSTSASLTVLFLYFGPMLF